MRQKSAKKATEKRQKSDTLATTLQLKLAKIASIRQKYSTYSITSEKLKISSVCGEMDEVKCDGEG